MRTSFVASLALVGALVAAATPAPAGITLEVYTDRAAFDARLGGDVRVVDFDDIDTSTLDPVAFSAEHYRGTKGALIFADGGQLVSRSFGFPDDFAPVSPPNLYAPRTNESWVYFYTGFQDSAVAGVGAVFIDADYPADGPSSLSIRTTDNATFSTGTVSGGDKSQLFRGLITIDDGTNQPTPPIVDAHFVTGNGFLGIDANEGVGLDDLVFATPRLLVLGEDCDNCIDDDGDGYVDRADGECDAPADGGREGIGDAQVAKAILKCDKATASGGAAFASGVEKQLRGCVAGVLACYQTKPDDAACLPKAQAKCAKAETKIQALAAKLGDALGKGCSGLDEAVSFDLRGEGYDAERVDCGRYGVTLSDGPSIGECLVRQHGCRATQLVSRENARALELAKVGGLDIDTDFRCLEAGANGNQAGIGDPARGKALVKCQAAIAKAGATYASKRQKLVTKCLARVVACLQQKPGDQKCTETAYEKCAKATEVVFPFPDAVNDPKTLMGKTAATIVKGCGKLPFDDVLADSGLGQGAYAGQCQAAGLPAPTSPTELAQCLVYFQACRADRLIEKQYPRAFELREIGLD